MELKASHHYDHGVDAVFRFFSEPTLIKAKYESIGTRNVAVPACAGTGDTHQTQSVREVPANVPGLLKKFLGDWNKVTQTEDWRQNGDQRICNLKVEIAGVPVSVAGTMTLRPIDNGCVNDIQIKVSCGIPLVGGKLAEFVAGDTHKAMDAEYVFIKDRLAQDG